MSPRWWTRFDASRKGDARRRLSQAVCLYFNGGSTDRVSAPGTPNFTVIIQLDAKPDQAKTLTAVMEELIQPLRAESGNVNYESFADLSDPLHFTIIEEWEREDRWQAHLQSPHGQKAVETYFSAAANDA